MTTTPRAETEPTASPTRKPRERISWQRFAQEFRAANPELFDPYDKPAIRDAMIEAGLPRSVQEDLLDDRLGLDRPALDPSYRRKISPPPLSAEQKEREQQERTATIEKVRNRTRHVALREVGPATVMADGRLLGDWTIGELRKLNGVFAFILAKAGKDDDSRKVRDVMRAADWKKSSTR